MKRKSTLWYIRSDGAVTGPFLASVVRDNLLLGRLSADKDEISPDEITWKLIKEQKQLKANHSTADLDHIQKRLNERNGFDRRYPSSSEQEQPVRRENDRRKQESDTDIHHRQLHTLLMKKFRDRKVSAFWPLIVISSILIIAVVLALFFEKPHSTQSSNCHSLPSSGMNWDNCLRPQSNFQNMDLSNSHLRNSQLVGSNLMNVTLSNSDLAYSDLRFANLSYSQLENVLFLGANLKNADLSSSNLSNANLSYADLSNANLGSAKLDNARFDNAIWINGKLCGPNSVGKCIFVK